MAALWVLLFCGIVTQTVADYEANWDSLDSRPLPDWYDKAKIGIFLHWGVYSVPSLGNEWFWSSWVGGNSEIVNFIEKNYPPNWTYQDFAEQFTAEFYDPDTWADLFKNSGAKYVVLTSKHHEGYAMWPSKYSYSWNANDVGPHRDLLGDLAKAVRSKDLHFGLYHSLLEWYHPLYEDDKANNWATSNFVDSKVIPEMKELISTYEPEVLWSDGNWESPDTYWKATEFLAWLYNESPVKDVIVSNDRWGSNTQCIHGDIYTCYDKYNPGVLQPHKWENAMTVDRNSWGYRRTIKISDILTIHELIETLTQTISCGGNILINVGPTKEGTIVPIFQERLLQLGTWLGINGDAIYESVPWSVQNDTLTSGVWYTSKDSDVYAIVLNWPDGNVLNLGAATPLFGSSSEVILLGNQDQSLTWEISDDKVAITLPDQAAVMSEWAWVIKITSASH
ncbi:hypothetical protein Zmor_023563 [Zophobas morio]|uniref:Putative alpha-L-fucosidase n=1 Tax=Zophobas morio TaxID=2755281 RepID=A0AA38HYG8_9CUCU|nr:hypothetical protein Zmor_023563 [Zophobas morio]